MVIELSILRCPFLFSLAPNEFYSAPKDHKKRKLLAGKLLKKKEVEPMLQDQEVTAWM